MRTQLRASSSKYAPRCAHTQAISAKPLAHCPWIGHTASNHRYSVSLPMALRHNLLQCIPEGVTPYAIAKRAGISTNTIYRLSNDATASMSWEVIGKLCAALNCQPGDLLSHEPD